ncbi:MAG: hypothetical protein O7D27_02560 [Alphaproteobacteria bacterium]|nr:hypothetical protein [Alphaproteobacteria bacterium]
MAEFSTYLKVLISIVQEWQTLTAAGVALFGAWLTIRVIRAQIRLQKSQIEDEKRSRGWAARAALPDALSALCEYSESCLSYLMQRDEDHDIPEAPVEAINVVKSSIEYVDPDSAKKLFELVVHYQVHNSRLRGGGFENTQSIYDAVYLRALVDRLFEFARNEVDTVPDIPIGREAMMTALRVGIGLGRFLDIQQELQPVIEMIERRHPEQQES